MYKLALFLLVSIYFHLGAATVTYNFSSPSSINFSAKSGILATGVISQFSPTIAINIPKFYSAMGTLQSYTISSSPRNVSWTFTSSVGLLYLIKANTVLNNSTFGSTSTINGVVNIGNNPVSYSTVYSQSNAPFTNAQLTSITPGQTLSSTFGYYREISFLLAATYSLSASSVSPSGNAFSIIYTYIPTASIPEPSTYLILGSLLTLGLGIAYKRKFSPKTLSN